MGTPGGMKGGPGAFPFIAGGPAGRGTSPGISCPSGPGLGPGCPVGSKPAKLHKTMPQPVSTVCHAISALPIPAIQTALGLSA